MSSGQQGPTPVYEGADGIDRTMFRRRRQQPYRLEEFPGDNDHSENFSMTARTARRSNAFPLVTRHVRIHNAWLSISLLLCFISEKLDAFSPTSRSSISSNLPPLATSIKNRNIILSEHFSDDRRSQLSSSSLKAIVEPPPPDEMTTRSTSQAQEETSEPIKHVGRESGISGKSSKGTTNNDDHPFRQFYRLPKTAYEIYTSYVRQLWKDTDTSARTRIANDKLRSSVRNLSHLLHSADEYNNNSKNDGDISPFGRGMKRRRNDNDDDDDDELSRAQQELLIACDKMLAALPKDADNEEEQEGGEENSDNDDEEEEREAIVNDAAVVHSRTKNVEDLGHSQYGIGNVDVGLLQTTNGGTTSSLEESKQSLAVITPSTMTGVALIPKTKKKRNAIPASTPEKKKQRSILFGAIMGAVVAAWVFSGNYIFTGVFCLMTILGQLEYYRMVMSTGVFPARRISVIGATSMFITALFAPELHQICLPMFGLWAMVWKLTMRQQVATIPEIATTFTGMFYLGYVPSFWVRIRVLGEVMEPTRLYPFTSNLRAFLMARLGGLYPSSFVHVPITSGAVFIFWSWISLAFSDVGAYFVGRKYGKTKLGAISPAAGATSPNKSVEGVLGGCFTSALFSIAGAWVQKWPCWFLTGAIHGTLLGLLGLIGDLTASMLKRDAGLKDFGNLIPEHGGIMDRVDSFVWTAPYSWVVFAYIIPALRAACGQ